MEQLYLKRYKIYLETLGPVFIGSGKELTKKEWILDKGRSEGIILDELKLFSYINSNNLLDSFETFMLKGNKKMIDWASEAGIYPRKIQNIAKYRVDCSGINENSTDKGVQIFIKDGYGMPYIPGSSLKGAIRNIILAKMIEEDDFNCDDIVNKSTNPGKIQAKRFLADESNQMNIRYFNTKELPETKQRDMVNDTMSGIRISDSEPVSCDRLAMCQKIDINIQEDEREMPLVRECIKPNTIITFNMTIDTTQTDITVVYIMDAIKAFVKNYNQTFLSKFKSEKLYDENTIYIGGGVGYHSKTVTSQVLKNRKDSVEITSRIINNTLSNQNQNQHKHYKDKYLGVSPHTVKLTEYDGGLMQFGPCKIQIESI